MTVYHPDPEINAEVIADALEGELADLAAGYAPRRWRCICGAEHSRGHFGSVGIHRCLACGYVGPGGVMLDDGEPIPAPAQPVTACPPSDVCDQIVPWTEVHGGEMTLWDGEYRRTEKTLVSDGVPVIWFTDEPQAPYIPTGTYTVVRRYTEGEPPEVERLRAELAQLRAELGRLRALAAPAFDEAAADRDERARYARHEGRGGEATEHTQQAAKYRQARDELLAELPQAAGRRQG